MTYTEDREAFLLAFGRAFPLASIDDAKELLGCAEKLARLRVAHRAATAEKQSTYYIELKARLLWTRADDIAQLIGGCRVRSMFSGVIPSLSLMPASVEVPGHGPGGAS